ncbi:MAG: 50S ribosomal protein L24 [Acidimicrobiales bacterium]|jgi:large subunit ribosomal protein L24|nr:50S ribosomal protein L24 [Acidimicrobiales bacterium]MDG1845085.1 50S ribosomal protein L24 [Acidimicrobiales bacterium]|tara:strand:+ start:217 stop:525 length:309 start_codon:yes stop_codon:yes gene_type:complete
MRIKKGDKVVVLSGKDRGKEGEVSFVSPQKGKLIVDGVNISKKHQRPTKETMQGGIIDKEMPIDASNVAVISPQDGKATRIGYRIANDGSKVRICRRTGADL